MTQKKKITPAAAFYRHVLAVNVKSSRKYYDLTQEKLAEYSGISLNQISKIERELVNVGLDILAALSEGLSSMDKQGVSMGLDKLAALALALDREPGQLLDPQR